MAKKTETISIDGRPYKVEDIRRNLAQRVVTRPSDVTGAIGRGDRPSIGIALKPSRETRITPHDRRRLEKPRNEVVFHGGRSEASVPRSYRPYARPMGRDEVRAEYQDRALKYAAGGLAASVPARAIAESRKAIRPAVAEWDAARRRAVGVVAGRFVGNPVVEDLTPQQYSETVRRNIGLLGKVPGGRGTQIVRMLGPGNYAQHMKVAAFRNALRLGLPLAGAGAAGLQYMYDRNRKHYKIDYRRPE